MKFDDIAAILEANAFTNIIDLMRMVQMDPAKSFSQGDWTGCNFTGCDMRGFDCTGAIFSDADFTNANIRRADFSGSVLPKSIVRAINYKEAVFDGFQQGLIAQLVTASEHEEPRELTVSDFLNQIKNAVNFTEAKNVVVDMNEAGLGPDRFAYTMLISKLKDRDQDMKALEALNEFEDMGGVPDLKLLNSVLSRVKDYGLAQHIFYRTEALVPGSDAHTFNMMSARSPDRTIAEEWQAKKLARNFKPDRIGWNSVIKHSANATEALDVIERMDHMNLSPEKIDYDMALENAKGDSEVRKILLAMEDKQIWPDTITFNRAIARCNSADTATRYVRSMLDRGLEIDKYTFKSIMKCCKTSNEIFLIVGEIIRFDRSIDICAPAIFEDDVVHMLSEQVSRYKEEKYWIKQNIENMIGNNRSISHIFIWIAKFSLSGEDLDIALAAFA